MKKKYSRGRHSSGRKKLNKKKVVGFIILLVLCAFFVKERLKIKNVEENTSKVSLVNTDRISPENNEINPVNNEKIEMPDEIENYKVIGQIIIEKINVARYILNKTNDESLDLSVTKLYGPNANTQGNLCIIGHNYEGLFIDLKDLDINDTFYIIDKENSEKVIYEVYDKYTVIPTDLDCLNQDTNNRREVTLITCNPRRFN